MRRAGLPGHQRGWLCRVHANIRAMADRGLHPSSFREDQQLKSILRTTGIPYQLGIAGYRKGKGPKFDPIVTEALFTPEWVSELWDLLHFSLSASMVRALFLRCHADEDFRKAIIVCLKCLDPKQELGASGDLAHVQLEVISSLLGGDHG